jgi:hypothetical protein
VRSALVTALMACSDRSLKTDARRFLEGLSSDELQFIAAYLGARILESAECRRGSGQSSELPYCQMTPDRDHKMILLLEYLRRSGQPSAA